MAKRKVKIEVDKDKIYVNGNLVRNRTDYNAVDDLYNGIADYMCTGVIQGNSHLSNLLRKVFNTAEKNIDKSSNEALKTVFSLQKLAGASDEYFESKNTNDTDYTRYLLDRGLFPWQRDVLKDLAKRIVLIAGRRAGKSYEIASQMIDHCLVGFDEVNGIKKYRQAVFIGLTLEKAAAVIWDILKDTIDRCHVNVSRIDNSTYSIEFANGSSIRLWGNNSKADREKLRGLDSSMFCVDECQSQQGLLYLINSIIGPIVKGRNGVIVLAGTGPLSGGTFWEDAITDGTWSVHKATMRDNPSIPDCENALEQVLIDNKWSEDNVTFRREYLAEIVHDTNRMPFAERFYYDVEPSNVVEIFIGLDFGFKDATAFIPLLVDNNGRCFVYLETKERQMKATDIVTTAKAKVDTLHKKFNVPIEKIHIVTDHNEPSIAADMYNQGLTNVELAYKSNKDYTLRLLKDALASSEIVVPKGGCIDDECERTVWKWNPEKEEVIYEIDDSVYHPDALDSLRYAYTQYLVMNHLISTD